MEQSEESDREANLHQGVRGGVICDMCDVPPKGSKGVSYTGIWGRAFQGKGREPVQRP